MNYPLFRMIKAAITPGIHPQKVNNNTINTLPHPLSRTAKGGKMMERNTRNKLMEKHVKKMIKR